MSIRDLLWVCPICHGPLRAHRKGDRCTACGTSFRRGRGDRILARTPGAVPVSRPAADWLDNLPSPVPSVGPVVAGPERVRVRRADRQYDGVFHEHELIGWVERFGRAATGSLSLRKEALWFAVEGWEEELPLHDLTAIQPSSSSLQLRTVRGLIIAIRFLESSVMRWELMLQEAVRRRWVELGKGRVVDFQPRIVSL